jgi:hypothetical protein
VWAIAQDHVNGNLLFAGTEFSAFVSVDGGEHWVALKGVMPPAQVRDLTIQRRENDLVIATFGRGFYILDDYSALRELTPQALTEEARIFAMRDAYLFNLLGQAPAGAAGMGAMAGNWTAQNPPFGAVFTFNLRDEVPADAKLVMTISDDNGKRVRRFDVAKGAGLRRTVWNLRADPPPVVDGRAARAGGAGGVAGAAGAGGGGRGPQQGPIVEPGRYRAQLGKQVGSDITPLGAPQPFAVVAIEQPR